MTDYGDERREARTEAPTEPLERGGGEGRGADVPLRGASHLKRNASLGKKRLGPLAEGSASDPSEQPTAQLGQGLIGWPADHEAAGEAGYGHGTREFEAADGVHEPASALRSWGSYFAQNPVVAVLCALLVALAAVGIVSLAGIVLGGGIAPTDHAAGAEGGDGGKAPGDSSGEDSLGKAYDAGTLRVGRQDGTLTLSLAPDGGTYTGTFPEDGEGVELRSGRDGDSASFDSPYSEGGTRAYGGHLRGSLGANIVIDARPEFDPGKAASAGWVPLVHGSYTVKARDGSFSAGGTYTDTLVGSGGGPRAGSASGPPTVERTYEETNIRNTTGATHPQKRSFRVRYSLEGDEDTRLLGVALNPTLVGYRLPEGVESD